MTENEVTLVAKIQHFYEMMGERIRKYEDACIGALGDLDEMQYKAILIELIYLDKEFSKVFEGIVYREDQEH